MKIYLASSWRNPQQPAAVAALRAAGHEVYDFRNPAPGDHGFSWSEIDPAWKQWTPDQLRAGLEAAPARRGFAFDMNALRAADATVLPQPCGRSAHLELGYAVGAGQRTVVVLAEGQEPELMLRMCSALVLSVEEAVEALRGLCIHVNVNGVPMHLVPGNVCLHCGETVVEKVSA
jgi:hypothetical protein